MSTKIEFELQEIRKCFERLVRLLEEHQEANMRMLNNVLKEAHENDDRDGDV